MPRGNGSTGDPELDQWASARPNPYLDQLRANVPPKVADYIINQPSYAEGDRPHPSDKDWPYPYDRNRNTALRPPQSFKKGGKVKKTGVYKLHKGERVVPAKTVKKVEAQTPKRKASDMALLKRTPFRR